MRFASVCASAVLITGLLAACASAQPQASARPGWTIVVHGGAGVISRDLLTAEGDAAYRRSLGAALKTGSDILAQGGTALDAVEATARVLEDDPLFNAGRGAVFSAEGRNELDASIMDGRGRKAGAAAGVTRTRHPISLARAVMEHSPHVLLSGEGAEQFARAQGLEEVPPSYFFTERRWQGLIAQLTAQGLPIPKRPEGVSDHSQRFDAGDAAFGTIGVVAMDSHGDLAAATSTGGTPGKRWGRIGDSPIIGAGTYAQNGACAVSSTGTGEFFIRLAVAHAVCERIAREGMDAQHAADDVVRNELGAIGGDGGVIVVDGAGRAAWSMNTPGMFRAMAGAGQAPVVRVYADEDDAGR